VLNVPVVEFQPFQGIGTDTGGDLLGALASHQPLVDVEAEVCLAVRLDNREPGGGERERALKGTSGGAQDHGCMADEVAAGYGGLDTVRDGYGSESAHGQDGCATQRTASS
jgi:hypothetical protein